MYVRPATSSSIVKSFIGINQSTPPDEYNNNTSNATSNNALEYYNSKLYRSTEVISAISETTQRSSFVTPDKTNITLNFAGGTIIFSEGKMDATNTLSFGRVVATSADGKSRVTQNGDYYVNLLTSKSWGKTTSGILEEYFDTPTPLATSFNGTINQSEAGLTTGFFDSISQVGYSSDGTRTETTYKLSQAIVGIDGRNQSWLINNQAIVNSYGSISRNSTGVITSSYEIIDPAPAKLDGLRANSSILFQLLAGNDTITLTGETNAFAPTGFSGDDIIIGNSGDNYFNNRHQASLFIFSGVGNDTIDGRTGTDTVYFGSNKNIASYLLSVDIPNQNEVFTDLSTSDSTGTDTLKNIEIFYFGDKVLTWSQLKDMIATVGDGESAGVGSFLTVGADNVVGTTRNDAIDGLAGHDTISGLSSNDLIYGGDGNDILTGGEGNDTLDGGSGTDTAVLLGPRAGYNLTLAPDNSTVIVSSTAEGIETIRNVENLRFSDGAVLSAPTLNTVNPLPGTTEDIPYSVTWAVMATAADEADVQGDPVAFRLESVNTGILTKNGVIAVAGTTLTQGEQWIWTPSANANGTQAAFKVRAMDALLVSANAVQVNIPVIAVNDAPVVTLPLLDQSTLAGSAFTYAFPINSFSDFDSAALAYSATQSTGATLPGWLSFNAATRSFSGIPGASNVGSFDVKVTASDGSLSVSDFFSITINDGLRPFATSFQPADGAKTIAMGSNFLITFNGPVQRGSGAITLKTADGKVVQTFTSSNATVSGSTLTLNPTADLSIFTKYVVELGAGAVKDAAGNGNAADSRYDFQTATQDGLYHFFVVAFAAAPGATYMGQLAEAVNFGLPLNQIVEIFTTKKQFTDVYPATMSNRELATQLVNNIVKNSASAATKQSAIDDIDAALGIGWSRGKMLYTVFGNLASKPLSDATWGNTAMQFQNQLAVARYFTEEMGVATETLATLRGVIANVTPDTDVSSVDKIVQIIGTIPPGG